MKYIKLHFITMILLLFNLNAKGQFNPPDSALAVTRISQVAKAIHSLSLDSAFRLSVYNVIALYSVEPYYFAPIDSVIKNYNINNDPDINDELNYLLDSIEPNLSDNNIDSILKFFSNYHYMPHIFVPNFLNYYNPQYFSATIPIVAYNAFEDELPITCLDNSINSIDEKNITDSLSYIVTFAMRASLVVIDRSLARMISNCNMTKPYIVPGSTYNCNQCSTSSTVSTLPTYQTFNVFGNSPNTLDHELAIQIQEEDYAGLIEAQSDDCLLVNDFSFPFYHNSVLNFGSGAYLSYVPNRSDYWVKINYNCNLTGEFYKIKKMPYPLVDYRHTGPLFGQYFEKWGNHLTLCESQYTEFQAMNEACIPNPNTAGFRFSNAYGIYKISRPIPGYKPLYFSYPYASGLWIANSPDIAIRFNTNTFYPLPPPNNTLSTVACDPNVPNVVLSEQFHSTAQCYTCSTGDKSFNTTNLAKDILVSQDPTAFFNYWNKNFIQVGFYSPGNAVNGDAIQFDASTIASNNCVRPNGTTLINDLQLSSIGEYDVSEPLNTTNLISTFYLEILVNYTNGTTINRKECFNLSPYPLNNAYPSHISIFINGNICNYSSTIVNYEIKIYQ